MLAAERLAGGLSCFSEPALGIGAHVVQIGLVGSKRLDPGVEEAGDVYPMASGGGSAEADEADALPRIEPLVEQLGKDPAVGRVAGRVEHGQADMTMIGHVERRSAPRLVTVEGEDQLRPMTPNLAGEISTKAETVFDDAVEVLEKRHLFDSYDAGAPALFLLTHGGRLGGRYIPEAGLSPRGQDVGDTTSFRGPPRDGTGGTVLEVVRVGDDGHPPLPFVVEEIKMVLIHDHTLDAASKVGVRPESWLGAVGAATACVMLQAGPSLVGEHLDGVEEGVGSGSP